MFWRRIIQKGSRGRLVILESGKTNPRITAMKRLPFSTVVIVAMILASLIVTPIFNRDPLRTNIERQYENPTLSYPFGMDGSGRDVFARVISAIKIDLGIAAGSSLMAFLLGTLIGAVSGYLGRTWDSIFMRLFDILQAIPGLLLGMLILAVMGTGIVPLIIIIAIINIPVYGRMVRAEVLPERRSTVVEAARLSMISGPKILLVYLLPRCVTSALAYLPVQAGFAVSLAAGFGFLGLGVKPQLPELGALIREGLVDLLYLGVWWTTLWPGVFLAVIIILLYRMGDWIMQLTTGSKGMIKVREIARCS